MSVLVGNGKTSPVGLASLCFFFNFEEDLISSDWTKGKQEPQGKPTSFPTRPHSLTSLGPLIFFFSPLRSKVCGASSKWLSAKSPKHRLDDAEGLPANWLSRASPLGETWNCGKTPAPSDLSAAPSGGRSSRAPVLHLARSCPRTVSRPWAVFPWFKLRPQGAPRTSS